jgi:hypothetical protein
MHSKTTGKYFKDVSGKPLVKCVAKIAANIAENMRQSHSNTCGKI